MSLLGTGAGTALRYGIDGVAYRTFTAPAPAVKQASLAALEQMGISFESTGTFEGGEVIFRAATVGNTLIPIRNFHRLPARRDTANFSLTVKAP